MAPFSDAGVGYDRWMSKFVGDQLNDALLSRLGIDRALECADRAFVLCTIDEHGWAHPAMASSLELVARDRTNVRIALGTRSRTVRNLQADGRLTLIVVDDASAHYIKGDVRLLAPTLAARTDHSKFNLRVDSVLEDIAADYEHARITSGIRIDRDPPDPAAARALLDELLAE